MDPGWKDGSRIRYLRKVGFFRKCFIFSEIDLTTIRLLS
jgi:hypothetical protein